MALLTRRAAIACLAAAALTGCGGVTPYEDRGPANVEMRLTSIEGGFLTARNVFVDVWTGPKGPDMVYLGTRKVPKGGGTLGLPAGQPLHLAIAFEEGTPFGGNAFTQTVEIPMDPIRPGQRYRLTVAFDNQGYDWDMDRIR